MTPSKLSPMFRQLVIDGGLRAPAAGLIEMVERKGLGHPDSICDTLAEELSRALCRAYLGRFGRVLHYNVDKALLRGGRSMPAFGGGQIVEPIGVYMAGRATLTVGAATMPIDELVHEVCSGWLQRNIHGLDVERHVEIFNLVRPGSQDLIGLFGSPDQEHPLANDTSFGVGFAPFTPLEQTVLASEKFLTEIASQQRPEVGEDVKVMGVRLGGQIRLTVSCAFIGRHLSSISDYAKKKQELADSLSRHLSAGGHKADDVVVNAADDLAKEQIFLTVTGTSAEAGDDGQVGRGNRATGLITPYRPMTLEATAGKNPVTHIGKIYNEVAQRLAERIVSTFSEVEAAECYLVSSIGRPIERPMACDVRLRLRRGEASTDQLRRKIDDITDAMLAGIVSSPSVDSA